MSPVSTLFANVTFNEAVTYYSAREEEALTSAVKDDQVLTDLAAEDPGVSSEGYLQDIGLDPGSYSESQTLEPAVQGQIRQNDLYSEERLQGIDKIGSEGEEDHEDQYYPTPAPSRAATLDPPEQSDRLGFAVREALEAIPDDPDEHDEEERSSDEIIVDLPDDHPLALSNIEPSRSSRSSSGSRNTDESHERRGSGSQEPDNIREATSNHGSQLASLTHGRDESDRDPTDGPVGQGSEAGFEYEEQAASSTNRDSDDRDHRDQPGPPEGQGRRSGRSARPPGRLGSWAQPTSLNQRQRRSIASVTARLAWASHRRRHQQGHISSAQGLCTLPGWGAGLI